MGLLSKRGLLSKAEKITPTQYRETMWASEGEERRVGGETDVITSIVDKCVSVKHPAPYFIDIFAKSA